MLNCKHCGNPFERERLAGRAQKFCSKKCRRAAEKRRAKERYKISNRAFRDREYTKATGLPADKARCPACDTVFDRYKDFENRQGWRKYCSEECSKEVAREKARVKNGPRDCAVCGKSFTPKTKRKIYCSKVCQTVSKGERRFRGHPITKEEFHALEEAQGGRCLICKEEKYLVIDHCHTEGHVRGLICGHCNSGLGMFFDNTEYLEEAIMYLKQRGGVD